MLMTLATRKEQDEHTQVQQGTGGINFGNITRYHRYQVKLFLNNELRSLQCKWRALKVLPVVVQNCQIVVKPDS